MMRADAGQSGSAVPAIAPLAVREHAGRMRSDARTGARRPASADFRRFAIDGDLPAVAIDHAQPSWGLSSPEAAPEAVDLIEPMGDPHHYRFHPAAPLARGHVEICGLADGFLVHLNDVWQDQPSPMHVSAPDILRVRVASDSDGEYVTASGDRLDLNGAGSAIVIEPAGAPPGKVVFTGHSRAATVYIHRSALQLLHPASAHELPTVVQGFMAGTLRRTVAQRLPLNAALLRCLEDLHGCDLAGHGRRLFIRSKAVEMLCLAFKALALDDDEGDVSAQIRRGVIKAQQSLVTSFAAPPSLDDLARDVGLSRSSLCAGFRQMLGQTVFDYVVDLRMARALALLNERKASITEIAYAVGYSHPSSFSLAVQKRFGTSPSELRRRADD